MLEYGLGQRRSNAGHRGKVLDSGTQHPLQAAELLQHRASPVGPSPAIDSSREDCRDLARARRWPLMANRWASSRTRCTRCSARESCGSIVAPSRPNKNSRSCPDTTIATLGDGRNRRQLDSKFLQCQGRLRQLARPRRQSAAGRAWSRPRSRRRRKRRASAWRRAA